MLEVTVATLEELIDLSNRCAQWAEASAHTENSKGNRRVPPKGMGYIPEGSDRDEFPGLGYRNTLGL